MEKACNSIRDPWQRLPISSRWDDLTTEKKVRDPWHVIFEKGGWGDLTTAEQNVCAVEELVSQVNNGGLHQYFFNSSGSQWVFAQRGLNAIGAKKHAVVFERVLKKFGEKYLKDKASRYQRLGEIDEFLSDVSSEWFDIKDENVGRLILLYNLENLDGRMIEEKNN